jgi:GTP-binding protein
MISALTGEGMDTLIGYLFKYREVLKKISTAVLNRTIQRAIERHHPPAFRGREIRVYYATQVQNLPQIFVIFTNHPQGITDDYQRYLTNVIREELGLKGIPVKLKFRKKT